MSTHTDCTGYEFAAGSIKGLRGFAVDSLGRLSGVHHSMIWKPGENVAHCASATEPDPDHPAEPGTAEADVWKRHRPGRCDDDAHGCGLWAYHDGTAYEAGDVHGVIEGYGRTTVGTKGFRCEKARIVALCLPETTSDGRPKVKRRWVALWSVLTVLNLGGLILNSLDRNWPWMAVSAVAFLVSSASVVQHVRPVPARCVKYIHHRFAECDCYVGGIFNRQHRDLTPELRAKIRRNYPDVAIFDSLAAMKAAHPVDPAVEPSPDNDPTFWDDKPKGEVTFGGGGIVLTAHPDPNTFLNMGPGQITWTP